MTRRAGAYAAEWTIAELSPFRRRVIARAPAFCVARSRCASRGSLVHQSYTGSRASVRIRRGDRQGRHQELDLLRRARSHDAPALLFLRVGVRDHPAAPRRRRIRGRHRMPGRRIAVLPCRSAARRRGAAVGRGLDRPAGGARRMTRRARSVRRSAASPSSLGHPFIDPCLGAARCRSDADRPVRRRVGSPRLVDGRGRRAAARRRSERHGRRRDHPRRARPRARAAAGARARHADARHRDQDRSARGRGDGGERASRFRRRRARRPRGGDSHRHGPGQRRLRGARAARTSCWRRSSASPASAASLHRSVSRRRAAASAAGGLREFRERADSRNALDADRLSREGDRPRPALRSGPAGPWRLPRPTHRTGKVPARRRWPCPKPRACAGARNSRLRWRS